LIFFNKLSLILFHFYLLIFSNCCHCCHCQLWNHFLLWDSLSSTSLFHNTFVGVWYLVWTTTHNLNAKMHFVNKLAWHPRKIYSCQGRIVFGGKILEWLCTQLLLQTNTNQLKLQASYQCEDLTSWHPTTPNILI